MEDEIQKIAVAGPSNVASQRLTRRPVRFGNEAGIEELLEECLREELEHLEDSDDTDEDPDFEPEVSDHESESKQEIDIRGVLDDGVVVGLDESNVVDINFDYENTNDQLSHVDEIIESVVSGAGEADPTPHEFTGFLRGFQNFFFGRQTKLMKKHYITPFKWRKIQPNSNVRTRQHNIISKLPGLTNSARTLGDNPTVEEVWNLLFPQDMLQKIIDRTNQKILKMKANYKRKDLAYVKETDILEIKALIGLLVFSSVFKSGNESVHSLFATDGTGREIFRSTMTKERFLYLLNALRFDDPTTRKEREKNDPGAAISELFEQFIQNCQQCYSLGEYVCVDEMLVAFRGKCKFKMYMPKKPAKYGLKIMAMTDARTNYLSNAFLYVGKDCYGKTLNDREKQQLNKPTQSVMRLVEPIVGSNRNVTADNWFSSIELVKELKKKQLTYVGTLNKNKVEIPVEFLPNADRDVLSSIYGFSNEMTLMSFVPKEKKAVIMVSSMHHTISDDPETGKPEIVAFYNCTKGGVDGLDHKCANYSSNRRTRRWPMVIFYTIVDVGCGVNTNVLHQDFRGKPRMNRMDFKKC